MNATPHSDADKVVPLVTASCGFPGCADDAATDTAMCHRHRGVRVSSTGSWLEAG